MECPELHLVAVASFKVVEWNRTTELKQMLGSGRYLCFPDELRESSLSPSDRKDKKNHTNKLRELALLIPVTMMTRNKKHTKKEILLRILHYIHYLQRSIDVVKALLKLHNSNSKGEFVGLGRNPSADPTQRRHSTPSMDQLQLSEVTPLGHLLQTSKEEVHLSVSVLTKPPDSASILSERPTWPQKPHRSLALNQLENLVTAYPGDYGAGTQDGELDTDIKAQSRNQRSYFLTKVEPYLSLFSSTEGFSTTDRDCISGADPSETHKETPDTDPWLPAWTSEDSPNGSPLASGSSQTNTCHVTNYLSGILGLSSSLFTSPSKILPDHVLEDRTYFLTEGLLESLPAVCELEDPQEKDTPTAPPNFQSSVSLDHCYLSLNENIKVLSRRSSSSESTDTESLWGQETPSDEDRDYTWTPTRRSSGLPVAGKKTKKVQASQGPGKPKDSRKACPGQVKKKCVNGFIMFCRMNRKQYIRACPGTASTAATKELAQLWREMTLEERRPYCTKARRFSRQHNRIVKRESSSSEDDNGETPKPFYQLLADKVQVSLDLASLPSPHYQ